MFWKKQRISDELTTRLLSVSRDVLRMQGIDCDPDLSTPLGEDGLGLSSLGVIALLNAVEKELSISIPERYWDYRRINTLGGLLNVICKC